MSHIWLHRTSVMIPSAHTATILPPAQIIPQQHGLVSSQSPCLSPNQAPIPSTLHKFYLDMCQQCLCSMTRTFLTGHLFQLSEQIGLKQILSHCQQQMEAQ